MAVRTVFRDELGVGGGGGRTTVGVGVSVLASSSGPTRTDGSGCPNVGGKLVGSGFVGTIGVTRAPVP